MGRFCIESPWTSRSLLMFSVIFLESSVGITPLRLRCAVGEAAQELEVCRTSKMLSRLVWFSLVRQEYQLFHIQTAAQKPLVKDLDLERLFWVV